MSLNIIPLNPVAVRYPPTEINQKVDYAVLKGTREASVQPFVSTSFSNSQIQWTANPPSRDHIIDRKAYVRVTYSFTVTGTTDGTPGVNVVQLGLEDAPRCFPFHTTCKTFQATLNNDSVSIVPDQYIQALLRYHNPLSQRSEYYSATPAFLDQYQQYNDYKTYGSALNALGNYGENGQEPLRGGFIGVTLTGNSATTCDVKLTVTEPIMLSPFLFTKDDYETGLIGIQNMMFTATLGNLSRIWSHNPSAQHITTWGMGDVTVSLPTLYLTFRTVPITETIPRAISYSYFETVVYPTANTKLTAGSNQTFNMSSVQLKTIPRRLYIYCRKQDNDLKNTDTDTFLAIGNPANPAGNPLSISFNNRVGLLSSLTANDLYQISQKNGYCGNFTGWQKHQGSVLCLEFGSDIGLAEDEAAGIVGNYQLALSLNVTNTSSADITSTLYVVAVNEGTYSVVDGSCQHMIGVLSKMDVLNAQPMQGITWKRTQHVYGGDFWSSLKNVASNIYRCAKKYITPVLNVVEPLVPAQYADRLNAARKLTGIGGSAGKPKKCPRKHHKVCVKGSKSKKGRGVLIGQGLVSRSELKNQLMNEEENHAEESDESGSDGIDEY